MDATGASEQQLSATLKSKAPDIWGAAAEIISDYDERERDWEQEREGVDGVKNAKPFALTFVEDVLPVISFLLVVGSLAILYFKGWNAIAGFFKQPTVARTLQIAVLPAFLAIVGLIFRYRSQRPRYSAVLDELTGRSRKAEAELENFRETVDDEIIRSGIMPALREYLDRLTTDRFTLELPDADTSGLAEVLNEKFEIATDSRERLERRMAGMTGGNIGVAGPRGVGKTTLLWALSEKAWTDPNRISVFTSAPVQYDQREFLMHLFSSACLRVIHKLTGKPEVPSWSEIEKLPSQAAKFPVLELQVFASFLLVVSAVVLFSGVLFLALTIQNSQQQAPAGGTTQTKATGQPQAKQAGESLSKEPIPSPAPYILGGLAGFVLGTMIRLMPGVERPASPVEFFFAPWWRTRRAEAAESVDPKSPQGELLAAARQYLLGLRFQQSYSSGWSGSLKLPIGVEGGVNSAVSFARQQLSLPELVYEYRGFVKKVASQFKPVIIAIDELDKLESDESAQKFLNGIKAIFGQAGVFSIVSVSQNAMSSFERRGLPFRDVFDSSFDEVMNLDYLTRPTSRRLIARRIVGLPRAYLAYCHAMSGGLPRDLIRHCRSLFEYRRGHLSEPNLLSVICESLIVADITAKLGAMKIETQRLVFLENLGVLLQLAEIPVWDKTALQDAIRSLDREQRRIEGNIESDEAQEEPMHAAASLYEELKAYLYFSLAAMETFGPNLDEQQWNAREHIGVFDRLAEARQWLAVHRPTAIGIVRKLRQDLGQEPAQAQTQARGA